MNDCKRLITHGMDACINITLLLSDTLDTLVTINILLPHLYFIGLGVKI